MVVLDAALLFDAVEERLISWSGKQDKAGDGDENMTPAQTSSWERLLHPAQMAEPVKMDRL